jgi:hypothetical protein
MTCAEFEVLLADWLDGALPEASRGDFEQHLVNCRACAAMAQDARSAMAFLERVPSVEPPPELLTRIAFELAGCQERPVAGPLGQLRGWLQSILQPRFAMGMAMTILSFSLLARFAGLEVRQLRASDLSPVVIWRTVEDKVQRVWMRTVKYYESLRIVYEVQTRLAELSQQEEQRRAQVPAEPPQKDKENGSEYQGRGR